MQVILGLIVLVLIIAVAGAVFRFLFKVLAVALGIAVAIPFAPALLVGFGLERIARLIRGGATAALIASAAAMGWAALDTWQLGVASAAFDSVTLVGCGGFALMAMVTSLQMLGQGTVQKRSLPLAYFDEKAAQTHALLLSATALFVTGILVPRLVESIELGAGVTTTIRIVYLAAAVLLQIGVAAQMAGRRKASDAFFRELSESNQVNAEKIIFAVAREGSLNTPELETIFDGIAAKLVLEGVLRELDLAGGRWFFRRDWYDAAIHSMDGYLANAVRHHPVSLARMATDHLALPPAANDDFIERHLSLGQHLRFAEGVHYVSFRRMSEVRVCVSCGFSEEQHTHEEGQPDWYCSKICRKTEDICDVLQAKSRETFLSEAASQGFKIMAGATAWSGNHKMFAAGGQGHGFAAEAGNHQSDVLHGRSARIVGGDNAANGADRLVNGQLIQTKYCKTPGSSVGQGFGSDGMYRYVDKATGEPMQLEVPRDQYDRALVVMRERMKAGKVLDAKGQPIPPEKADTILRKGELTYDQAKNITKFGTLDSLKFDLVDGAVVGVVAGGISFGVCAFVHYFHTRDHGASLRAAAFQFGKTFGSTMMVYVGAQQLHRLAMVQKALTVIDFSSASPTTLRVLRDGLGVKAAAGKSGVAGINKAVRGTVVTSMVLVLVTTGPDMLKLMRGRISQAQFFKNAAVGVSGIAGGALGSVVGGAALSPLGPVGMVVGRVAGGVLGGLVASGIASIIANELVEDDRIAMLAVVREQMEYLARSFMLSAEELDNLNANLETVVTSRMLESLHAAKGNRHALANQYLKPTVVGVVKQRPPFGFGASDVALACEMAA
ncbi:MULTISPECIES: hypothetical protein [Dyella]|uniref:Inner membrane protein yeeR n=2 Tax=Dyella TaxID=231454 RepID=A0A4R0YUF5_9GAMM|nr:MULTISPECIES: hypothetical protein [Dyella]TBR39359.1 hypothetical protein EYV96_03810 [Dyella terrae]TCI13053.1 hypothetical protein EZM97_07055 [Dyella soli]